MAINPYYEKQAVVANQQLSFLAELYKQSVRILYTNLKPDNFYNAYASSIPVNYAIFPVIFQYFYTINQNEVNLVLQNYSTNVQSFIDWCNENGCIVQLNTQVALLKNSMVSLNTLASTLLTYDISLSYKYTVPTTMSIRRIMFNNNKNYNDPVEIKKFLALNSAVINDVNNILAGTIVTIVKNGVGL